jgi:hypothetical protein
VPDVIQLASTGRAQCRGCGRKITAQAWRFGESLPNPFAEGEALYWFHLTCAACMRPEKLLPALNACADPVPGRDWLRKTAEEGLVHRRLPRLFGVERASSGRARCRSCRELIASGAFRLTLHVWEEGRFSPTGFLHPECCEAHLGTADVLDRLTHLVPELDAAARDELRALLATERQPPSEAESGPALAKTTGDGQAETDPQRKRSG